MVEVTIFASSISGIMLISSEVRVFMEEFGLGLIGRDSALLIRIFILILYELMAVVKEFVQLLAYDNF